MSITDALSYWDINWDHFHWYHLLHHFWLFYALNNFFSGNHSLRLDYWVPTINYCEEEKHFCTSNFGAPLLNLAPINIRCWRAWPYWHLCQAVSVHAAVISHMILYSQATILIFSYLDLLQFLQDKLHLLTLTVFVPCFLEK